MSVSEYREDFSSLIPALHLLTNLGYNYLNPSDSICDFVEIKQAGAVLDLVLREQLKKFNTFNFKGKDHSFQKLILTRRFKKYEIFPLIVS